MRAHVGKDRWVFSVHFVRIHLFILSCFSLLLPNSGLSLETLFSFLENYPSRVESSYSHLKSSSQRWSLELLTTSSDRLASHPYGYPFTFTSISKAVRGGLCPADCLSVSWWRLEIQLSRHRSFVTFVSPHSVCKITFSNGPQCHFKCGVQEHGSTRLIHHFTRHLSGSFLQLLLFSLFTCF